MNWMQRTLRALSSQRLLAKARRRPLAFDSLEDRSVPAAFGAIAGQAFYDLNGNGVLDAATSEFALPGATVTLTGTTKFGSAVNETITTFADPTTKALDGWFRFEKLEPGEYTVTVANYTNFTNLAAGAAPAGGVASGSLVKNIVLEDGQSIDGLRFGFKSFDTSAITGKISLRFVFNTSTFTTNVGSGSSLLQTGGEGRKYVNDLNVPDNALIAADTTATTSRIDGRVYVDADIDGTRDSGETGQAGVVVELSGNYTATLSVRSRNPDGTISTTTTNQTVTTYPLHRTATTDASGNYSFANLPAGANYTIQVTAPAGFRSTGATPGSLGGGALDTARVRIPSVAASQIGTGYDFGVLSLGSDALVIGLADAQALSTSVSDPTIRGKAPAGVAGLEAAIAAGNSPGTAFVSVQGTLAADGSFTLTPSLLKELNGGSLPDGQYTVSVRATGQGQKDVSFTLKTNAPTLLNPLADVTATANAANRKILLSGTFDDADIQNSLVTMTILNGATEEVVHLEMFDREAPTTVNNFYEYFSRYAADGGALFHRIQRADSLGIVQSGGFPLAASGTAISTTHIAQDDPIRNEPSEDRRNVRGTLAMAKPGNNANGATSEFFFNLKDANGDTLNANNGEGFTVFGQVKDNTATELAFLDAIMNAAIITSPTGGQDFPLKAEPLNAANAWRIKDFKFETPADRDNELTYEVTSDNPSIVAASVGGFQGNMLTLDFLQNGTATITVTVRDSQNNTMTDTFSVTVTGTNTAPTISAIGTQSTNEDTPTGTIAFTVGDAEAPADSLTVTASSSNTTLVPVANVVLSGTGASRTVVVTPTANATGTSTITLTVSDGVASTQTTFVVSVSAVNDAPTITAIAAQTTDEDVSVGPLAFTIGDPETAPESLTVTATSSNQTIVPNANLTFGGSGANRTISVAPAINANGGPVTITVNVSDGSASTQTTFNLTVNAVNDLPTISSVINQNTSVDTAVGPIPFTIGDVETAAGSLTVTATSNNQAVVPDANLALGGSGSSRTVTVTPATGATGTATITLTVSDGTNSATSTFDVEVA